MNNNYSKIVNILLALSLLLLLVRENINHNGTSETSSTDNSKGTITTIHQRKSVRSYTSDALSKEQLETLVRAGMAAPSAGNKQPWAFYIVEDKATLNKLGETLPYAKMTAKAHAAIIVCGDLNLSFDGAEEEYWVQDCSAASQNILLAAESMGLGAVWTGVYPMMERAKTVSNILNLPENHIPLNVIPVGVPDMEIPAKNKWDEAKVMWK